jgi:hypothetical protein
MQQIQAKAKKNYGSRQTERVKLIAKIPEELNNRRLHIGKPKKKLCHEYSEFGGGRGMTKY